jgi:tetratricopeptide (TPR) repeat protein
MGRKARLREGTRTTERVTAVSPPPFVPVDRKPLLVACLILTGMILAVFARVGTQDFINYDDPDYVTTNAMVRNGVTAEGIGWAFTKFHSSNWHPLTWITHMIDVQLFGLDAGAHKLVNVAFHAGAAIFLLLFLFRATGALWPSAIVAALFALHPTRVESVAWVSERKDVLSAFFWMLTLFLYAGYVRSGEKRKLIGVTIAFACALMSKPSAVTLPFVLLLLDWWPFARLTKEKTTQLIVEKLPLFALLIPSILLTLRAQTGAIGAVSFAGRFANAILSYADYLRMLVWPSGLAILYPYRASIQSISVVFAVVVLIAITVLAIAYARRAPYVIVGWLWFLGTLVPMSGLVQVGRQAMADRYTYISYVGLFIAIVWAMFTYAEKYARPVAIAILVVFSGATFVQAGYWKNSETLFAHALDATKGNDIAHLSIGAAMLERGAAQEALDHLRKAVEIDPRNPLAQNNLGRALAATGDAAGAERAYRQAMALDPNLAEAYRNLADVKMRAGQTAEATALLQKANGMKADTATRAELAAVQGDVDTALTEYAAAVREAPDNAEIHNGYAAMLARKGRDNEAMAEYLEALRINPAHYDANMNLGALFSRMGRDADATQHFQKAAEVRPNTLEPHIYLALIYGNSGDAAKAVQEVEAAAKIDPAEANRVFSNAVRIPFKETNLADYRAALLAQSGKR